MFCNAMHGPVGGAVRACENPHASFFFQDARMGAISSSNGIDDILKRAMGNRSSLFKRT
jgi:hypothetical protein